uniref:Uncharacterized protein n=1 Tax=Sphaerodactylus townsendi TaxID=933632 RepID=A0ACB8FDA8_9SAUR
MISGGEQERPSHEKVLYPCRFCDQVFAFGVLRAHVRDSLGISDNFICVFCSCVKAEVETLFPMLAAPLGLTNQGVPNQSNHCALLSRQMPGVSSDLAQSAVPVRLPKRPLLDPGRKRREERHETSPKERWRGSGVERRVREHREDSG